MPDINYDRSAARAALENVHSLQNVLRYLKVYLCVRRESNTLTTHTELFGCDLVSGPSSRAAHAFRTDPRADGLAQHPANEPRPRRANSRYTLAPVRRRAAVRSGDGAHVAISLN
ncbi:hypothetical protein EVAR_76836_1 [Eumeta japonica]|uniref:Uncharacterized protein n=1 Tax=Eumeta variegata TaxID=151549 RepID=A0A4C1YUT5_EUMVA|nr:hypothetical protein EVAR_76836_1 [Eumeta japonica]